MIKLKTLLLSEKLATYTSLRARTRNETRWGSTFDMLQRYQKVFNHPDLLDSRKVAGLALNTAADHRVNRLFEHLENLDSFTRRLQKNNKTIATVRALFNCTMEDYPVSPEGLSSTTFIIKDAIFDSRTVKLPSKNIVPLLHEELNCLNVSEIPGCEDIIETNLLSYDERTLKRQKLYTLNDRKLVDLRFLLLISNIFERLFSKIGYYFTDHRMSIIPVNLESKVFLHFNRYF